jgi:O-antigen ligase
MSVGPLDVYGSDVAIALVVAAALLGGAWSGFSPLRRARVLWTFAAALFGLYAVSCFWTPLDHPAKHLVTAGKLLEYGLLAPALVLLLRRRKDIDRFLLVFVGWSVAATGFGLLQFLGVTNVSTQAGSVQQPGQREVSFLGIHDFAAFSGAALALGFAGLVLGDRRRTVWVALVAGTIGTILAASVYAFSGIVLAAVLAAWVGRRTGALTRRRALALGAITLVVAAGVYDLRAGDVSNFFSFLGNGKQTAVQSTDIQTGAHRVVLGYIGLRIWLDHPILGVGLDRSTTQYAPYLADAHRRYPHEAASSFPSPQHPWGVQNLWIQTLADEGVVGLVVLVGTFAAGLTLALRALRRDRMTALVAAGWVLVAIGTWNANGILAGAPLDALTWFGFGLAAVVGTLE